MPADKDTPARVIQSDVMDGTGEPGKGLTGASFRHGVEFRELRQPNPRVAHSRSLNVRLTEGGGMDDAEFAGGTKFEDGATTASGLDAKYQVSKGRLLLTGKVGTQSPQVQDDRISVVSTKIDMAFEGPKLIATGEVQSVMKPSKKAQDGKQAKQGAGGKQGEQGKAVAGPAVVGPNTSKAVVGPNFSSAKKGEQAKGAEPAKSGDPAKHDPKTPGLLKDDQPANVTAANLDYDGEHDKAIYTGSARLWQGDTAIAGDTITIDQTTGDLYASSTNGLIRSTMMLEQLDSKTQRDEEGADDRDGQGHALRGRAAPRDVHDQRARERAAGRSARREDRAVLRGGRRIARARRGVRRRDHQDRRAHVDRQSHDVLRRRRALSDERHAGESRRELPRNCLQNLDLLEID